MKKLLVIIIAAIALSACGDGTKFIAEDEDNRCGIIQKRQNDDWKSIGRYCRVEE